ncbi:MAG TPA: cell wall hydrolase [Clostridia bacterium]|nr:cell wall hydrolase [Clostridia bacterium]
MAPTDGKQESTPEPTLSPASEPTPSPTPVDFDELIAFYNLEADHYYSDYGYSSNHYAHTDEELYMLAQLIYGEARGESTKGKIAVANVVMNRVLSRGYPGDTIKAVITASGQFSGYSASIRPNSACVYAARQVLEKEVWVIPQNVYFFQSDKPAGEDWGGHEYYTEIGGHCFYIENYSGRNRSGKIPPALYERVFKWPQYGCEPGKRVYRIQYILNKLGYAVKADSYFGQTTKEAVVAFQTDYRLSADGVAGPSTIKALIKAYGESAYCAKFA